MQSNAVIDSLDAHTTTSTQNLNEPDAQAGLMKVFLDYLGLYESLRDRVTQPTWCGLEGKNVNNSRVTMGN